MMQMGKKQLKKDQKIHYLGNSRQATNQAIRHERKVLGER